MTTDLYIAGIKPADEKYRAMLAAWDACVVAGVNPPREITAFFGVFDREEVDPAGAVVDLSCPPLSPAVREWENEEAGGYEIDLRALDPDIKIIRVYNA
jgi:hypothetical protein